MAEYVAGIDLGTTSVKAVVFDQSGQVMTQNEVKVETIFGSDGSAEQNPEEVLTAAGQALTEAVQSVDGTVIAAGFSNAMHAILCMDEEGNALSNAWIWSDRRAHAEADGLLKGEGLKLFQKSGTPIHPMSPFIKLLWMKNNQYKPYLNAAKYISLKEYILWHWFGTEVVDFATACATGLMDIEKKTWDEELLQLAGIQDGQLFDIVSPDTVLGHVSKRVSEQTGIPETISFVIGAADGQLATLGSGAVEQGEMTISAGTSAAVRQWTNGFQTQESHAAFCYLFDQQHSIVGGASNNGGVVIEWLKKTLNAPEDFQAFLEKGFTAAPGSNGLLFLPFINGERAPLWDAQATGEFAGLSITHQQHDLIRAVLEGVTLNLYHITEELGKSVPPAHTIYVNGGLARSDQWLQLVADIFGKKVIVTETHHTAAWGAAWTAMVGLGMQHHYQEIKSTLTFQEPVLPDMEQHRFYQGVYGRYKERVALRMR
ncbi:gluconokinase [Jeotgalibacillus aurantiacus]|uniref:gluconokinase n=1 Tax=Jeotgalibacillus aurantiacus TaxID=2763266 RepID=UPI001D0A77FA|nr:gluconokinase [Jeotgalibacillus aurantiacus]